jgi:hypothetical protein
VKQYILFLIVIGLIDRSRNYDLPHARRVRQSLHLRCCTKWRQILLYNILCMVASLMFNLILHLVSAVVICNGLLGSPLHTCSNKNIYSWGHHYILVAIQISFSWGHHYILVAIKVSFHGVISSISVQLNPHFGWWCYRMWSRAQLLPAFFLTIVVHNVVR